MNARARSFPLLPAQSIHDEFEMCDLDVTFTRCAHDVIEHRCEFQDLEPMFSQVPITANVSVTKAEHMPEFMRERPRRQIAGCECDVSADKTVRGLCSCREYGAVLGKTLRMRADVNVIARLRTGRHTAKVDFNAVTRIAVPGLP